MSVITTLPGLSPTSQMQIKSQTRYRPSRTPTETLVVDFMVGFIAGIACLLQPLSDRSVCVANSFETTYQFGPVRSPGQAPNDSAASTQFRARIDGSIPFCRPQSHNLAEMVIFEVKRAPCDAGRPQVAVKGQQSLEHVAYVWERHKKDPTVVLPFRFLLPVRDGKRFKGKVRSFLLCREMLIFCCSHGALGRTAHS